MTLLTGFSSRWLTLGGGLLATGAAVLAEVTTTDPTVGTGSFLLGGAGLIAAISAFTRDYWTDRQKQREHEVMLLRIRLKNCLTCAALHDLYIWAQGRFAVSISAFGARDSFRARIRGGSKGGEDRCVICGLGASFAPGSSMPLDCWCSWWCA